MSRSTSAPRPPEDSDAKGWSHCRMMLTIPQEVKSGRVISWLQSEMLGSGLKSCSRPRYSVVKPSFTYQSSPLST